MRIERGVNPMSQIQQMPAKRRVPTNPRYEIDENGVVWEIRGEFRRDIGTQSEIFAAWRSLMARDTLEAGPELILQTIS